jgi:hypothetical protein
MKIIISKPGGLVLYAREDLTLTAQHATGGDWADPGTTTANATLIDGVTLPAKFTGGAYSYSSGVFSVANQALIDQAFPTVVPETVTMVKARGALILQGLKANVDAALSEENYPGMEGDLARNAWEKGTTVSRHDPLVLSLKPAIGLTDAQLDALFILADTL